MNSIGKECTELKQAYDECFNAWFADKFLRGAGEQGTCDPLFRVYQNCVRKAVKDQKIDLSEIEKKVLGSDLEQKPPPLAAPSPPPPSGEKTGKKTGS